MKTNWYQTWQAVVTGKTLIEIYQDQKYFFMNKEFLQFWQSMKRNEKHTGILE